MKINRGFGHINFLLALVKWKRHLMNIFAHQNDAPYLTPYAMARRIDEQTL